MAKEIKFCDKALSILADVIEGRRDNDITNIETLKEIKAETKTFALANFDKDRILSREFFRNLDLPPNMTDKEILQSFDISDVDGAEKAVVIFADMRQKVKFYLERIKRHALKLENVNKKIAVRIVENGDDEILKKKFKHSKVLSLIYNDFTFDIGNLFHRIQDRMDACAAVTGKFYRERFAKKLKDNRKKKKMTQLQFAQKLGIVLSGVVAYEGAQRDPSLSMLWKMAKILDVSPLELI